MRKVAVVLAGILLLADEVAAQHPLGHDRAFSVDAIPDVPEEIGAGATTGQTLYGVGLDLNGSSYLYRIDNYGNSPRAQIIGDTQEDLFDMAINPVTGRFYGLGEDGNLYELDPITGAAAFVGDTEAFGLNALEFDNNGEAWAWSASNGNLYRVDKEVGVATRVGNTGFASGGDLAFDTNGTLYGTTASQLIRINKSTGVGTLVGSLGFTGAFGLEIDSDGTMYAGRGSTTSGLAQLYRVNKNNGAATLVASISGAGNYGLAGLAFSGSLPGPALLLQGGRFKVEANWRLPNGSNGSAQPVQLTPDTGYFWFFDPNNVEIVIKVLNGCGVNSRFWVFAGGLTNVLTEIRVTNTATGVMKTYTNPQGKAFQPIQDTAAFASCP